MKRHVRSLSLVLGGAVLGGLAASTVPGARAQEAPAEADASLPADLRGKLDIQHMYGSWGQQSAKGKIVKVVQLNGVTFLKLDTDTIPDFYIRLDNVVAITPTE